MEWTTVRYAVTRPGEQCGAVWSDGTPAAKKNDVCGSIAAHNYFQVDLFPAAAPLFEVSIPKREDLSNQAQRIILLIDRVIKPLKPRRFGRVNCLERVFPELQLSSPERACLTDALSHEHRVWKAKDEKIKRVDEKFADTWLAEKSVGLEWEVFLKYVHPATYQKFIEPSPLKIDRTRAFFDLLKQTPYKFHNACRTSGFN